MIFVTVGTTMPFDELLVEIDRLVGAGLLPGRVLCQTGQSAYRMVHAEHFRAAPSIDDLIREADLVVTHGGATVIQLLIARKPFVAVPNPRGAGDHQRSFLNQVAEVSDISWTADLSQLERLIADRTLRGPASVRNDLPRAAEVIRTEA